MKKIFIILFSIISLLIIYRSIETKHTIEEHSSDRYISLTTSYITKYNKDIDVAQYGATVFEYDLDKKEKNEIFTFPYNSFSSLGVYNKKTNSVYYVKEKNNNSYIRQGIGNQIYEYNLDNKVDRMLTNELFAVNSIIPVENALFFIGAKLDNLDSVVLGKIDLCNGKVTYWNEPISFSTNAISIDKTNKRIYVTLFENKEMDEAIRFNNENKEKIIKKEIKNKIPKYTICSFDYNLKDKKELISINDYVIKALYVMDNIMLYRMDNTIAPNENTKTISKVINLENMETLYNLKESFPAKGSFSIDKKGVYVLLSNDDEKNIYYYDFERKKYTLLINNDFGDISNFQLIY